MATIKSTKKLTNNPTTISLCLIVKDEEKLLAGSLDSVKNLVDEIIIVDTGSTDNTVEIANQYTNKVYYFEWIDDFAAARNFAQSKATCDYVFRWDADWLISVEESEKIQSLKKDWFENADQVYFTWDTTLNGDGKPTTTSLTYFIYRSGYYHWELPIHEMLVQNNPNALLVNKSWPDIHIQHLKDFTTRDIRSSQNITIMESALQKMNHREIGYTRILKNYIAELYLINRFDSVVDNARIYLQSVQTHRSVFTDFDATVVDLMVASLIQLNNLSEAKTVVNELYVSMNHLRRIHILAGDIAYFFHDFHNAAIEYETAQNIKIVVETFAVMDVERLDIYVKLQLAKLYFASKDHEKSRENLYYIISNSSLDQNIMESKHLLNEIKFALEVG